MDLMKKTDSRYVSSVVLTNKARLYNEQSVTLMPYLKKEAKKELNEVKCMLIKFEEN